MSSQDFFDKLRNQSTKGGLISFAYSPRDSKGAGVNEVPGARQSRDLARPQARSPVRVTTSEQSPLLLASSWFVTFFYAAAHSVGLAVYFLCSAPPITISFGCKPSIRRGFDSVFVSSKLADPDKNK